MESQRWEPNTLISQVQTPGVEWLSQGHEANLKKSMNLNFPTIRLGSIY